MRKRATALTLLLVVVLACGATARSSPPDEVPHDKPDRTGPAIHWQTGTVDLRADRIALELDGQTFSPTGSDVTLVEDIDTKSRWYLHATWSADGHDNIVRLRFRTSARAWSVVHIEWWVSDLVMPDGSGAWGAFYSRPRPTTTPTRVGQTLSGDLEPPIQGQLASCEPTESGLRPVHEVDALLILEGLRLTLTPPQPSLLDRVLWFLGLAEPAATISLSDVCGQ